MSNEHEEIYDALEALRIGLAKATESLVVLQDRVELFQRVSFPERANAPIGARRTPTSSDNGKAAGAAKTPNNDGRRGDPLLQDQREWMVRRRTQLGLTQADLAKIVGVHAGSIFNWETAATAPRGDAWDRVRAALSDVRRV